MEANKISENKIENVFNCNICLNDYIQGEKNIIYTPCIHGFHKNCIKPWLEINIFKNVIPCPLCKTDIKILVENLIESKNDNKPKKITIPYDPNNPFVLDNILPDRLGPDDLLNLNSDIDHLNLIDDGTSYEHISIDDDIIRDYINQVRYDLVTDFKNENDLREQLTNNIVNGIIIDVGNNNENKNNNINNNENSNNEDFDEDNVRFNNRFDNNTTDGADEELQFGILDDNRFSTDNFINKIVDSIFKKK